MIKYHDELEQNTPEWLEMRLGLITASTVKNLLTGTFKISKDKRIKLFAYQLAAERITRRVLEQFVSFDMERGHVEEEIAFGIYSENFLKAEKCGFITNDELGFKVGFSPDGLVSEKDSDGIIEIKSRLPKFQIQTICNDAVPSEYMLQLQFGMLVSGREWCDFIQYSNGMPLFVKRVYPDLEIIETLIEAVTDFEALINQIENDFLGRSKDLVKCQYIEMNLGDEITMGNE